MEINIRLAGPAADQELSSFYRWLREEPEIRNHASVTLKSTDIQPGELGAVFDIIQLVVDSSFQALSLALAFAAWRSTRTSKPKITIECGEKSVAIEDVDSNTVDIIVRTLE
jgi:hypothetical protein